MVFISTVSKMECFDQAGVDGRCVVKLVIGDNKQGVGMLTKLLDSFRQSSSAVCLQMRKAGQWKRSHLHRMRGSRHHRCRAGYSPPIPAAMKIMGAFDNIFNITDNNLLQHPLDFRAGTRSIPRVNRLRVNFNICLVALKGFLVGVANHHLTFEPLRDHSCNNISTCSSGTEDYDVWYKIS